jgi:ATP-dependent RNA helicase RhlE
MLQILGDPPAGPRRVRALILTPTRELAAQVNESVHTYGKYRPIRAMEIYGGVSPRPQITKINRGVDVVIATPGRLLDHVRQGNIDLSFVEMFVLDEADRMLDMGFIRDIKQIIKRLPKERQNMLFSATFSKEIRELANNLLDNPAEIQVAARNTTADRVEQLVYPVDKARKRELLSEMIGRGNWQQVLVFTRTKHGANRLAKQLNQDGIESDAIHGNKGQGARAKALRDFKAGKVRVLVATDIAARGLDIQKLPHVVNFELPHVPEDYVHRIGRTARAGQDGTAISLVCIDEQKLLKDIEQLLKRELKKEFVPGYEVDKRIRAEPLQKGRPQKRKPRNAGSPSRPSGRNRPGKNARNNQRKRSGTAARPRAS